MTAGIEEKRERHTERVERWGKEKFYRANFLGCSKGK